MIRPGETIEQSTSRRSLRAWVGEPGPDVQQARLRAQDAVLRPGAEELRRERAALDGFLRRADVRYLVPMYEPEDPMGEVPLGTLAYLLHDVGVDPGRILVLDQGSAPGPLARAAASGARLLHTRDAARRLPDTFRERFALPSLDRGKGLNIFLGILALAAEPEPLPWVAFADADLRDPAAYDFARYLAWPMCRADAPAMSVATHVGRNNEVALGLRFALEAIVHSASVAASQRARVAALWPRLCRQVHMLGGERIVSFRSLVETPLTTGYGVETCLTVAAIERGVAQGLDRGIAQVLNPTDRRDIPNGRGLEELVHNEQRMMNSIARLLLFLVLHERPLSAWDAGTVREANTTLARMLPGVPLLPSAPGPMEFPAVPEQRFLPAVGRLEPDLRAELAALLSEAR